jgi:hypothetical protein
MIIYQLATGALGLIVVALLAYVVYLRFRKSPFTRERFAFVAMWAHVVAISVFIPTIAGPEAPWVVAANLAAESLGLQYRAPEAGFSDKTLCAFLLIGLMIWTQKTFGNWKGPKSTYQSEHDNSHENPSIIRDGLWETKRVLCRQPPPPLFDDANVWKFGKAFYPVEPLAWRHRARELISLRRPSFHFDADHDWHEAHTMWIGENVRNGAQVGLLCVDAMTALAEAMPALSYLKSVGHDRNAELFIVGRDHAPPSGSLEYLTVTCFSEANIYEGLVDFEDYFRAIETRVKKMPLPDSELTIRDVYVPSQLCNGDDVISEDLCEYLRAWLTEPGERHLAILGGYGQGKSTGALMFTYDLIQRIRVGEIWRVPVFIELRGKSPATLTPLELMGTWASLYGIDPRAMLRLLEAGRLVIILDAFDEMAEAGTAEARVAHFTSLWKLCYPSAKLVFTGRQHFLLDDKELKAALGVDQAVAAGPYCQALTIPLFDISRIASSLRAAPEQIRDGILALAQRESRFFDVIARPSLLHAVTRIWRDPAFVENMDMITSGIVLRLFIRHSYKRQSEKLRRAQNFMTLAENEREYFMLGIAAYMAHKNRPNQIRRDEFEAIVTRLYNSIPEIAPNFSLISGAVSHRPLRLRMNGDPAFMEKIITDVRTYGIIEIDPSRLETLRFSHKSFYETLLAEFLSMLFSQGQSPACRAISFATGARINDALNVPQSIIICSEILMSDNRLSSSSSPTDVLCRISKQKYAHIIIFNRLNMALTSYFIASRPRYRLFLIGVSVSACGQLLSTAETLINFLSNFPDYLSLFYYTLICAMYGIGFMCYLITLGSSLFRISKLSYASAKLCVFLCCCERAGIDKDRVRKFLLVRELSDIAGSLETSILIATLGPY